MNIERPVPDGLKEKVMVTVPTDDDLQNWFTYHPPTAEDVDRYLSIREGALQFARVINEECPNGPDKTTAIRKVREAVMTANAAIACCGSK
jgi:hypothetical protein